MTLGRNIDCLRRGTAQSALSAVLIGIDLDGGVSRPTPFIIYKGDMPSTEDSTTVRADAPAERVSSGDDEM